jgi:hypothetical protein
MYPAQCPIIPCIALNHAQLHISGKTICSKLKQSIRDVFTIPPYFKYVAKQFHWTPLVMDTIDWTAYTQAIARFGLQRIQISKLCNNLLPTVRWAN